MRIISLFLVTLLLSGCGFIMGKRIDFGSDFADSDNAKIKALSGKTFYITNDDDFERLISLKKELRELSNAQTPTRFLQQDCMRSILQVTDQYDSGICGFLFTGKINLPSRDESKKTEVNNEAEDTLRIDSTKRGSLSKSWWFGIIFWSSVVLFKIFASGWKPKPDTVGAWKLIGIIFGAGLIIVCTILYFFPHIGTYLHAR